MKYWSLGKGNFPINREIINFAPFWLEKYIDILKLKELYIHFYSIEVGLFDEYWKEELRKMEFGT